MKYRFGTSIRDIESKSVKQKLLIISGVNQKIITLDGVNKVNTGFEKIDKVININCNTCCKEGGYLQCLSCKDYDKWNNEDYEV